MPANTALSTYPSLFTFVSNSCVATNESHTKVVKGKLRNTALVRAKPSLLSQPAGFRCLSVSPTPDHLLPHGCHRQHFPEVDFQVLRHRPTRRAFHSVKTRVRNSE